MIFLLESHRMRLLKNEHIATSRYSSYVKGLITQISKKYVKLSFPYINQKGMLQLMYFSLVHIIICNKRFFRHTHIMIKHVINQDNKCLISIYADIF